MENSQAYAGQARALMDDFFAKVALEEGSLIVLGLSTSEVTGAQIGRASAPEAGVAVVEAVLSAASARGHALAVQCCEHLNRALVVEKETMRRLNLTPASVVPYPNAGGAGAAAAYALMGEPVVVEAVQADAGIDVGVTMIGMHLRPVVVPVRTALRVGSARADFCHSRPRLIGGERARYM